ncbi:MAG TPA: DUF4214 domain-containing protein [Pirellulales bacterium]|nr:DUF4214 domain-containing protein [Pirellulales bacterium]
MGCFRGNRRGLRRFLPSGRRPSLGLGFRSAWVESLENRLMLDIGGPSSLPPTIVVGRTLSAYDVPDVQNNQETITLTVYNQAADPISGVLLTDTLESDVTFAGASQLPDQNGQQLAWSLGTIQPFDRANVTLTVSLTNPIPTQLDTGATAYGTLDAGLVSWTTAPAVLRATAIAPALLASTPDANTADPYIQEEAAQLNYDPTRIYGFLQTQIGYNSYVGSLRGARGTLWSNAGNALDDASLGVALLRASGIPAQYEEGTLSPSQSQQLILSMFPASYQNVGYLSPGTPTSDPTHDPQLLLETEDHFWFQYDAGSGMTNADPEFAGQPLGQAATASTNSFTKVPDNLRQKTEVRLTAEIYSQADAAFAKGTSPFTDTVVLDQTFNDVDLVGKPLSIGNFVNASEPPGLSVSSTTYTYSPYIDVGDAANPDPHQDQLIHGTDYQEVLTTFPLGSQVLSGLFLNVTLSGPNASPQTFAHTILDRIGYTARQNGGAVTLSVDPNAPPALTNLDVTTVSLFMSNAKPEALAYATSAASRLPTLLSDSSALQQGANAPTADASASSQQADSVVEAFQTLPLLETLSFAAKSDANTSALADTSNVVAYDDRPRVVVASAFLSDQPDGSAQAHLSLDLMEDQVRVVSAAAQASSAAFGFNLQRGIIESVLEGMTGEMSSSVGESSAVAPTISTSEIFDAATQQNIPLVIVSASNLANLASLNISAEAKARITAAVDSDKVVLVPARSVTLNGTTTVGWYEVDPATGAATGVLEDGSHGADLEWVLNLAKNVFQFVTKIKNETTAVAFLAGLTGGAYVEVLTFYALLGIHPTVSVEGVPSRKATELAVLAESEAIVSKAIGIDALIVAGLSPAVASAFKAGAGFGQGAAGALLGVLIARDPPLPNGILNAGISTVGLPPANSQVKRVGVLASLSAGTVTAQSAVRSLAVSGPLAATWATSTTTALSVASLNALSGSVASVGGQPVGSGVVGMRAQSARGITIQGNVRYAVNGTGSLSFYGPAESTLGVSGNWSGYAATVTGDVAMTLTVPAGDLTLDGQPLPAGTYTITTASATLFGEGLTMSPTFAGSASISTTAGALEIGPGAGSLSVNGAVIDPANVTTVTGYNGAIEVAADGNGTDAVTLSGQAGSLLTVAPSSVALTTDQNTSVSFNSTLQTSFADTYDLVANAPTGWTVTIDDTGTVTAIPAPGTQAGTYPIQIIAQSTTNPDLVSQTTVEITVTATSPGMTLAVMPDTEFSVPFNGAEIPSAFRATMHNTGPAADTYDLAFSNVPAGFTISASDASVTVPAGDTGIVGLYLQPAGTTLPPPGTILSFTVTATSTTNPAITHSVNVSFTMPAIEAATVTSTPAEVATTPGVATTAIVTIMNVGNVAYDPALAITTDGGLTISGLNSVGMIPVGQFVTETATLTPDSNTPLNSILNATVNVAPAAAQEVVSVLSVNAITAVAAAPGNAAGATSAPPTFVTAGQSLDVSADVLSAVGQAEQGEASFTVTNSQGAMVFSSTSVPVTLSAISAVATLDLGDFSTGGFIAGEYAVHVTVADGSGNPIPGATGTGNFVVGLPVSASLSSDADNQTPGAATSNETMTVASNALLGNVQTDSTGESVAVKGSLAYVAGSQDLSVVDISNPARPNVLSTFGGSDINLGGLNLVQVAGGDLLVASQDPTNNGGFKLLIYSLANPNTPTLVRTMSIPYAMLNGMTVHGTTAYFSTSGIKYDANGTVTSQVGNLVAVDFSNPAVPTIAKALFDDLPQPDGHAANIGQTVVVNDQIAYVTSSSSTGGNTQTGTGQLLVVDTSPAWNVGATLDIPGTVQSVAVAVDGTHALVVGSTGGWTSPFGNSSNIGLSGNVTLTLLDISNPANPTIIGSTVVTQNTFATVGTSQTGTIQAIDLGDGRFAVSGTLSKGLPAILCVDASDPSNLTTSNLSVSFGAAGLATVGGELLTASPNGLSVYQASALVMTPVTVTVTVPTHGLSVVPASFSILPTGTTTGADAETFTWTLNLAPGAVEQITWQTNIGDLQANQVQPVATGATVQFATGGSNQTLSLPGLNVAGVATPTTLVIPVQVAVPGAAAIANASTTATALGMTDLAARLGDLSTALTNLVETPTNVAYKSQALAALASILSLMANDPNLEQFVAPLTAARDQLVAASSAADIQAAVVNLGGVLTNFDELVTELEQSNVRITLIPSSIVAQPGVAQNFDVRLQNMGTQTTTYDLSVSGLPASVTSQFDNTSVTIAPGQTADLALTLTQAGTSELAATGFQVSAAAENVTIPLVRSAGGALTARQQFVSVSNVSVTPPFANAGTQIALSAQLLNAVNQTQQGSVTYTVTDPGGKTVFTSAATPVTLTVQTSLVTVNLPMLDTTGFALGQYTVHVTVVDSNNNPIPGATANATLLIGSPVTATSTVSPQTLPTGDSTVTNTLTIDSHAALGNSFSLVGQLPDSSTTSSNTLNGDTVSGVALNGKYAYVFGNQGVHVVDISDPTNPQALTTQSTFPQSNGAVAGNQLIAINAGQQSGIAVNENSGLTDYDLSGQGTPQSPFREQTLFPNYTFANSLVVSPDGTHAFVSYEQVTYDTSSDTITAQNGTLISFNIANPSNLTYNSPGSILFNTNAQNDMAPLFQNGGNNNLFGMAQPNANTLLVGASSSTGGDTQTGVGEILVVDVSNPDSINSDPPNTSKVLDTLQVPGTVQVHGIALDGNVAFVVASQGGWLSPFTTVDDIGPTGNLVLATIDISNLDSPQLIHEQTLNRAARGGGDDLISLGNHLFAFSSLGESTDTPEIVIVDASDPNNLQVVDQIEVPGGVRGLATDGQYLYASGDGGLLVYSIAGVGNIPVKAQVEVPNGTGVAVVPGSFSVPPTQIIPGGQFDTLEWDLTLDPGNPNQTLTWQTTVSDIQPGESRAVTSGTTVDFTVESTPSQVTLPEQDVVADQILQLSPAQQTTQPGQTAQFTVTVLNPTANAVTYDLAVQGLPQGWAQIAGTVTVPAGGQQTVPLSITSDPFAALASDSFIVTATAGGTSGSVTGTLVLAGQPVLPPAEPDARGVVATITPVQSTAGQSNPAVYTVTLTNTGSVTDTYLLTGLFPAGFSGAFSQTSITAPPGVSNFRDVQLTLTPPAGAAAQSYPFTVAATSTADATIQSQANGAATVVAQGVQVSLTPGSGAPGGTFELKVTNTGSTTDTFNLSLASSGGLVSTLGANSVTLAPGASQTVPITTGAASFAVAGSLPLTAIATSQTNAAVNDQATANLAVASRQSMTAAFSPPQQTLPQPGSTSFLLQVDNTGNTEDSYSATIIGTTGDVSASLVGLDGQPTQSVPTFILPGLSNGGLTLQVSGTGSGAVTVLVQSLTDSSIKTQVTAQLNVATTSGGGGIVPTAASITGYEFSTLTAVTVATFSDGSLPAGGFAATIDWGDGATSAGSISLASGVYTVTGSHEYLDEGRYTVEVGIKQTAGPATGDTSATVSSPATLHEQRLADGTVGTPNQNWVQEVYRDVFHRQAEMQGLDYWVGELTQGTSRAEVAYQMVKVASFEEFQRDAVAGLYEQYLGRAPDTAGLTYWAGYLYGGGTIEGLSQALVSSPEYWQARGGGTVDGFLDALFRDALGRPIDQAALTYFGGLMAGGASAADVAEVVFTSDEYHRVRVNELFEQFLDRPADPGAFAYFAGELDAGATDELVITQLISSDEYYNHAQT